MTWITLLRLIFGKTFYKEKRIIKSDGILSVFFIIYSFFISNLVPLSLYARLLNHIISLSGGKKYVCLHPEIF